MKPNITDCRFVNWEFVNCSWTPTAGVQIKHIKSASTSSINQFVILQRDGSVFGQFLKRMIENLEWMCGRCEIYIFYA